MSTTAQIRELIAARSENRNVDYKGPFSWTEASSSEKCRIIKDILAFSNTSDGGLLIIGVNKDGRTVEGLTQEQTRSFDTTTFNDFLQRYTDPRFSCRIAEHEIDQRLVISVTIPEFQNQPIICKADANDEDNRSILKRGALYVRTDAARSEQVSDSEMMRELLSRALLRKQNELLRAFEQIVNGSKFNINAVTVEAPYAEERAIDSEFFQRNIPQELQNYGHWIVSFYPESYEPDRIPNLGDLRNLVQQTTVALRGWNFPHTDRNHVSNFAAGFQSLSDININGRRFEAYRFRLSGLFNWIATYWDDGQEEERRTLSFIGVIYQLTEIFLFASRLYERIAPESNLVIEIKLTHTENRELVSNDPLTHLWGGLVCTEPELSVRHAGSVAELRGSSSEQARKAIIRIFQLFNWNDPSEQMIANWQERLLTRQFN